MTDQQIAEWMVATCLAFGCTVATAYRAAGHFVAALEVRHE